MEGMEVNHVVCDMRIFEVRYRFLFIFFFQAEDGIRDLTVTGVQTCALPIFSLPFIPQWPVRSLGHHFTAVIKKGGKPVMFDAAVENPGKPYFAGMKMGKIFRRDRKSVV